MDATRTNGAGVGRAGRQDARREPARCAHTGRRHGQVARVLTLAALCAAGIAVLYVAVMAVAYITLGIALMLGTVPA